MKIKTMEIVSIIHFFINHKKINKSTKNFTLESHVVVDYYHFFFH